MPSYRISQNKFTCHSLFSHGNLYERSGYRKKKKEEEKKEEEEEKEKTKIFERYRWERPDIIRSKQNKTVGFTVRVKRCLWQESKVEVQLVFRVMKKGKSCLHKSEGPRLCYLSTYLLIDTLYTKCRLILIPTYEASYSPRFTEKEVELTTEQSWDSNPGLVIPKSVRFPQQHSNSTPLKSTEINSEVTY